MVNLKKIKKDLVKLNDEELKDVLSFLTEDEEEVTEQENVQEEVVETKEEVKKEEPKKQEVQSPVIQMSKEDLNELISGIVSKFVTKEEIEEVKETVDKVSKKAKPFGATSKSEKTTETKEIQINDYLAKVNSQFV